MNFFHKNKKTIAAVICVIVILAMIVPMVFASFY